MEIDNWIVNEVIYTLHLVDMTLLGITGLDSPQEIAKKRVENETAISRMIKSTLELLESSIKEK